MKNNLSLTETERRVNVLNLIGVNFIEPNNLSEGRDFGSYYGDLNLVKEAGCIAAVYAMVRTDLDAASSLTRREMGEALRAARRTCDRMGAWLHHQGLIDKPRRFREMFTLQYLNLTAYWNDPAIHSKTVNLATAGLPPVLEKNGYGDLTRPSHRRMLAMYLADEAFTTDLVTNNQGE